MNNAVYWSVVEEYLSATPELLNAPPRVTIEHEAPISLGDKLEIIANVHPAGSTENFGRALIDRTVTTLTYAVGDETKSIASMFALSARACWAQSECVCGCSAGGASGEQAAAEEGAFQGVVAVGAAAAETGDFPGGVEPVDGVAVES